VQKLFLLAILAASSICSASPVDIIFNGSFELGFSGWGSSGFNEGGCGSAWHPGTGATGCNNVDNPALGSVEASNAFDGTGPKTYRLTQTFNVPGVAVNSAILSWIDTSNVNVGCCGGGTQSREFYVDLTAGITSKVYSQLFVDNCGPTHPDCTPEVHHWTGHSVDVTSFLNANVGQNVTLGFNNFVPQVFTGAGGFGLDGVSLLLDVAATPEPGTVAMLLIGSALLFAGRKRLR